MPKIHLEIFPPGQRRLWDKLQSHAKFLKTNGFYLAGGTALALQLGHRQSHDFDFFSSRKALASPTQKWLQGFVKIVPRDFDVQTLHAEADGVKVSFISGYKYKTVEPLVKAGSISVASLIDIGLMKLLALTHRATLRDYLDLAALLRGPVKLQKLLRMGKRKYGSGFNEMIFLRALVTFEDMDSEMPVLLDPSINTSWQQILRNAVKNIA